MKWDNRNKHHVEHPWNRRVRRQILDKKKAYGVLTEAERAEHTKLFKLYLKVKDGTRP